MSWFIRQGRRGPRGIRLIELGTQQIRPLVLQFFPWPRALGMSAQWKGPCIWNVNTSLDAKESGNSAPFVSSHPLQLCPLLLCFRVAFLLATSQEAQQGCETVGEGDGWLVPLLIIHLPSGHFTGGFNARLSWFLFFSRHLPEACRVIVLGTVTQQWERPKSSLLSFSSLGAEDTYADKPPSQWNKCYLSQEQTVPEGAWWWMGLGLVRRQNPSFWRQGFQGTLVLCVPWYDGSCVL